MTDQAGSRELRERVARALYERSRTRVGGRPPWERLSPADDYDRGMLEEALAEADVAIRALGGVALDDYVAEATDAMRRAGIEASPMWSIPETARRSGRASLDTDQVAAIWAAMAAVRPRLGCDDPELDEPYWRCYHCGETFRRDQEYWARQHFGRDEGARPVCLIREAGESAVLAALRAAEDELAGYRAEDGLVIRAAQARDADHRAEVRRVEAEAYDRGVAEACRDHGELLGEAARVLRQLVLMVNLVAQGALLRQRGGEVVVVWESEGDATLRIDERGVADLVLRLGPYDLTGARRDPEGSSRVST